MSHAFTRPCYCPSGGIRPLRTSIALVVMAIGSFLSAGVLFAIFAAGFCMPLMWMIVPALITWLTSYSLHLAHCRNRCLAVTLTFLCGLGGYAAYFHIDQCVRWQTPWTAVNRLPGYIVFRIETDRSFGGADQALDPAPGVVPWRPAAAARPNINWILLLLDLLPLAIATIPSWRWAGLPYSRQRRQWHRPTLRHYSPEAGQALERALAEQTVADWAQSNPQQVETHLPHYSVTLWFVRNDGRQEPDTDVYLQIGREAYQLLTLEEVGALAALFPELQEIAGPAPEQLAEQAREMKTSPTAEIWPVPADDPARQSARLNWLLACSVYGLVLVAPAVLIFVVICAGLWAVQIFFMPGAWFKFLAVGLGVPVIMGLAKFWIHPMNPFPACLADRLVRRRLQRAFARRAHSVLQGHAGDAIPAVMRPRNTWSFLGAASQDVNRGLLLFDIDERVILFEGERENYIIPVETILSGRVEALGTGEVHQSSDHAVVLKVQLGEGVWELPFLPLAVKLHSNRWYRARQLLVAIDLLCDRQWSDETSQPPRTLDEAAATVRL